MSDFSDFVKSYFEIEELTLSVTYWEPSKEEIEDYLSRVSTASKDSLAKTILIQQRQIQNLLNRIRFVPGKFKHRPKVRIKGDSIDVF